MIPLRPLLLLCLVITLLPTAAPAERIGIYQQGTIVRMRMGACLPDHGIIAALAGNSPPNSPDICPEYTLVADKVVYVMVGKPSKDVLPLADTVAFRLHKNQIAVRVDDNKHEARFLVREMILRAEWEHRRDLSDEKEARGAFHYEMPMLRAD